MAFETVRTGALTDKKVKNLVALSDTRAIITAEVRIVYKAQRWANSL